MCLSIKIKRPDDVLAEGKHAGLEWVVTHNGIGYRCGYVRLPAGHPWHGQYEDIPAAVHGGITFADSNVPCSAPGPDDAWWIGFDCSHGGDAPDPSLPSPDLFNREMELLYPGLRGQHVWTQEEVEAQCRSLAEQAARVQP